MNRKKKGKFQKSQFKAAEPEEKRRLPEKGRAEKKRFPGSGNYIFGVLPVTEALRAANRRVEKIFIGEGVKPGRISEMMRLIRQKGIAFQKNSRQELEEMVGPSANHQGIVALTSAAEYYPAEILLEEVFSGSKPLILILDGVEDPRNLGAILRVAECSGVDGVFIPERRAVGLNETVVKSSAGASEYVKVAKVTNLNRLIDELKENNIWVIGASGEAEMNHTGWDWTQPTALVLGGEGSGLHRLTAEKCDALVKIPLKGRIESLNVSVAAGVILFEAVRQRESAEF
ncbi:MAG: 23S rRNA (guanosine(2251)-2'-O)-methyltransferase RlmB [Pyrinomonadaceae bacterium]